MRRGLVFLVFWAFPLCIRGGIHDCWDPEKLSRMTFPLSDQEANDPSLGKFSKLLKCLMQQQSKQPGGLNNMDWSQWQKAAGSGQFPPGWNQQPGWTRPGANTNANPNRNYNWQRNQGNNVYQQGNVPQQGQGQPRPGVHPDDWTGGMPKNNVWPVRNPGQQGPPAQMPTPNWEKNNKDERRRNRNQRRKQQGNNNDPNRRPPPPPPPPPGSSMSPMQPVPMDGHQPGNWDMPMGAVNDEESRTTSLNRQYGYTIMACTVVILAVLMVSAIFCCNSSNSTMSQPATHVVVNPPDTYSIYSYQKQPVIGSDTLRSSATLGVASETLRSTASPQYRVSDIDPDFARRFHEEHY